MEKNKILVDTKIKKLLRAYDKAGNDIKKYITQSKKLRFSRKKFVADLGEYYFYENCKKLFRSLTQEKSATAAFDFRGEFKSLKKFILYQDKELKIEVKTRHAQIKDPYLLRVRPNKFHLLVFVFLNEDYSCNYIGILERKALKGKITGNQNRLVFKKNLVKIWETDPFEPFN